jgi:hypothetical protein
MIKFLFIACLAAAPLLLYWLGESLLVVWQAWGLFTVVVLWLLLKTAPEQAASEKPDKIRSEVEQLRST